MIKETELDKYFRYIEEGLYINFVTRMDIELRSPLIKLKYDDSNYMVVAVFPFLGEGTSFKLSYTYKNKELQDIIKKDTEEVCNASTLMITKDLDEMITEYRREKDNG